MLVYQTNTTFKTKEYIYPLQKIVEVEENNSLDECMHLNCPRCGKNSKNKTNLLCVHMIACRCKRCSPYVMS